MSYAMQGQGYSKKEDGAGTGEVTIATILDNLSKVRPLLLGKYYNSKICNFLIFLFVLSVSISFIRITRVKKAPIHPYITGKALMENHDNKFTSIKRL